MSFEELKAKVAELSADKQLELAGEIIKSLRSSNQVDEWQFLGSRPHEWRKQLYIKGSRLPAAVVWDDMTVNERTVEEAADDWDLPIEAVQEAIRYCEINKALLKFEADEEGRRLAEKGVLLEPATTNR